MFHVPGFIVGPHELLKNANLTSHHYTETTQCIICNCYNPLQTKKSQTGNIHASLCYSITKVLVLNTIIELPRLHIPHLRYLKQGIFFFFYYNYVLAINVIKRDPDNIDEKRLSFTYNVSSHPSSKQEYYKCKIVTE